MNSSDIASNQTKNQTTVNKSNRITSDTQASNVPTPKKRERGKNKVQFDVWTAALPIFAEHYDKMNERGETAKFFQKLLLPCGYTNVESMRTAYRTHLLKWMEAYVANTGPNATGAERINLRELTKQFQRTEEEIMDLLQAYRPIIGKKRRIEHLSNSKIQPFPKKPKNATEAIDKLAETTKDNFEFIKNNDYLAVKKQKLIHEDRAVLQKNIAFAQDRKEISLQHNLTTDANFWDIEIARNIEDLKKLQ